MSSRTSAGAPDDSTKIELLLHMFLEEYLTNFETARDRHRRGQLSTTKAWSKTQSVALPTPTSYGIPLEVPVRGTDRGRVHWGDFLEVLEAFCRHRQ